MSKPSQPKRYYYIFGKQIKNMVFVVLAAVVSLVIGVSLQNRILGAFFMLLACFYPLMFCVGLLQRIRRINYVDLDTNGLRIRTLGVFRKYIPWSAVASFTLVTINGVMCGGITYYPSQARHGLAAAWRKRTFGHEELLRQACAADGSMVLEAAAAGYSKVTGRTAGRAGKVQRRSAVPEVPVQLQQMSMARYSDYLRRPDILAWLGVSLVCDILASVVRSRYQMLGSILDLLGLVAIFIAGANWVRFRRVSKTAQKQTKTAKPNDWSNLM